MKEEDRIDDLGWISRDSIAKYRQDILAKTKLEVSSPALDRTIKLVNDYCDAVEKVIDILIPLYDSPYGGSVILSLASLCSGCGHIKDLDSKVPRLLLEITSSTSYAKSSEEVMIMELLKTLKGIMPKAQSGFKIVKEGKEEQKETKVANGKGKEIVDEAEQAAG